MRTLTLLLASILACAPAAAAPLNIPPTTSTTARPIRVSLVNMSGTHREVVLSSGAHLELPPGILVTVESKVGATLLIVSDTDKSVNNRILLSGTDVARIVTIH